MIQGNTRKGFWLILWFKDNQNKESAMEVNSRQGKSELIWWFMDTQDEEYVP